MQDFYSPNSGSVWGCIPLVGIERIYVSRRAYQVSYDDGNGGNSRKLVYGDNMKSYTTVHGKRFILRRLFKNCPCTSNP